MAERPNKNIEGRDILSLGPNFRIDKGNPQMGCDGTNVYAMYATTENNDVCLTGLTEGGKYRIYNDRNIEIIAGNKENSEGVDIVIAGMNGDVTITAMKNGKIRIKGKNIMIEADEDIDLMAGRNITATSNSGRILMKANKIDQDALTGNAITNTFGFKVFENSFVGADIVKTAFEVGTALVLGPETASVVSSVAESLTQSPFGSGE